MPPKQSTAPVPILSTDSLDLAVAHAKMRAERERTSTLPPAVSALSIDLSPEDPVSRLSPEMEPRRSSLRPVDLAELERQQNDELLHRGDSREEAPCPLATTTAPPFAPASSHTDPPNEGAPTGPRRDVSVEEVDAASNRSEHGSPAITAPPPASFVDPMSPTAGAEDLGLPPSPTSRRQRQAPAASPYVAASPFRGATPGGSTSSVVAATGTGLLRREGSTASGLGQGHYFGSPRQASVPMAPGLAAPAPPPLYAVCLATFDLAVGNTISFAYPPSVWRHDGDGAPQCGKGTAGSVLQFDGRPLRDVKGLQDFCFPDGAHDTEIDYVPIACRLGNHSDAFDEEADIIYGAACYHLLKDRAAERGARQRAILVLTRRPMFHALRQVLQDIVRPLLQSRMCDETRTVTRRDEAPPSTADGADAEGDDDGSEDEEIAHTPLPKDEERGVHEGLVQQLYVALDDALSPLNLTVPEHALLPHSDSFPVTSSFTAMNTSGANTSITAQADVVTPPRGEAGKEGRIGCGVRVAETEPWGCERSTLHFQPSYPSKVVRSTLPPLQFRTALSLPLPDAPLLDQWAHGSRVAVVLRAFGRNTAQLFVSLIARQPIIVVGSTAEAVSAAVLGMMHLVRGFPIAAARFVPYAPIELVDQLTAKATTTLFAAVGATNAFVQHRTFPGVTKAFLDTGEVEQPPNTPSVPKAVLAAFDALTRDASAVPPAREVILRATIARFNFQSRAEFDCRRGGLYKRFARRLNVFDAPLDAASAALNDASPLDTQLVHPGALRSPNASALSDVQGMPPDGDSGGFVFLPDTVQAPRSRRTTEVDTASPASPGLSLGSPRAAEGDAEVAGGNASVTSLARSACSGQATPAVAPKATPPPPGSVPQSPVLLRERAASLASSATAPSPQGGLRDRGPSAVLMAAQSGLSFSSRSLGLAITAYQQGVRQNARLLERLAEWHARVLQVLGPVAEESEPHLALGFSELFSHFEAAADTDNAGAADLGITSTDSRLPENLVAQQQRDAVSTQRRVAMCRQRAAAAVDVLCCRNNRGARRKDNQRFCDLFTVPATAALYIPGQLLLATRSSRFAMDVEFGTGAKRSMSSFGDVFLSRNYLCFQPSSMPTAGNAYQVIPFDAVTGLEKQRAGGLSMGMARITLTLALPEVSFKGTVVLQLEKSTGFYELLQVLYNRQQQIRAALRSVDAAPHGDRVGSGLSSPSLAGRGSDIARDAVVPPPPLLCPVVVPAALYDRGVVEVGDEVVEAQRKYPVVGWASRLLPTDPPQWSDRLGLRRRRREDAVLPPNFRWSSDWCVAPHYDDAADGDREGWVYGVTWSQISGGGKAKDGVGLVCRRRRWVRRRRAEIDDAAPALLEAEGVGHSETSERALLRRAELDAQFIREMHSE